MGLEPTSKDFGDLCSIQLSYGHEQKNYTINYIFNPEFLYAISEYKLKLLNVFDLFVSTETGAEVFATV